MLTLEQITRRAFLTRASSGVGSLALASLLHPHILRGAADPGSKWNGVVTPRHIPPRIKRVIWLTMAGGPSHLDTFDYKPVLAKLDGKPMPESYTKGQQLAQLQGQAQTLKCLGPQHAFKQAGKSGAWMSDQFPHLATVADDICIIRSMHTEAINHDPAHCFFNTGSTIPGRPSMGSWINYGLGSDAENLPGFVVLVSTGAGRTPQPISVRQWSAGFLPSRFQGVQLLGKGDPVLYLGNPGAYDRGRQGDVVKTVNALNEKFHAITDDPEIAARIAQYEMAFQMQASVPELTDMSKESPQTLELYGCKPGDGSFASNCLLARRLAESGVRFIQLYHRDWDHHQDVKERIAGKARDVDRACMALITDLKGRGLFEDTLIVWSGEFGRTPMTQSGNGRDHHMLAFSLWLSGGAVKGGMQYGATDELGYKAVENPVSVHDVHATMLHLLGIDHTKLVTRFQGRDYRLTDVFGKVVKPILT